jgi:energy-coupling factor transporter ATP-binding protein EcfA2
MPINTNGGSGPVTTVEHQTAVLKGLGRLEALISELDLLKSGLDAVPLWRPATALGRQCDEALRMIRGIAGRFERSLVVTLIGPSGSGKSTLINALAGGTELSPMGHSRPTTETLVVFSAAGEDAADLVRELGGDSVDAAAPVGAGLPKGLCLIDTPDTDSTALRRHIPALHRAIDHADVLLCVFDAENPKRRDHADFLAPFVQRFDGQSLVAVLNKCDRLDEAELKSDILPDFLAYLQKGWEGALEKALCVCSRRHLREPGWDPSAGPRHAFDQFEELRDWVFGLVQRGSRVIDRRIENARQLHTVVLTEAGRELAADREALGAARRTLEQAQAEAMAAAAAAWRGSDVPAGGGLGVAVYQRLAGRWFGPVGWLLAFWMRLMSMGSGIAAILRFVRPSVGGLLKGRPGKDEAAAWSLGLDMALQNYRVKLLERWPEAAEQLIQGRFDPSVRGIAAPLASAGRVAEQLSRLWEGALEQEIERIGRRLGGLGLQALMNAPVIGILCYVGGVTVKTFFSADYLSGDYFLHAFWVIAIALLLSFFALQLLIRLTASPERILSRALSRLQREAAAFDGLAEHPLRIQLENVLRMAAAAAGG